MRWRESWRADPGGRRIADNHYNRQSVGSDQFVPPGRCVVLVIHEQPDATEAALWVTSWPFAEYVKHSWPGAWVCSAFRNQRRDLYLSSSLITEALACTRFFWEPPAEGMISFVDPTKTHRKRDPGRCFLRAGFHVSGRGPSSCWCADKPGRTAGGLVALHIGAETMPPAAPPLGSQGGLWG